MGALLALIPTKDWFIGAAVAVIVVLAWHYHDKYVDAVNYAAQVKAESAVALQQAQQQIKDQKADYDARLQASEVKYEDAIRAADVQHAADDDRLRKLAATRAGDPVLQGSAGTAAEAAAWASRLGRVERISAGLADALRYDDDALSLCYADRDSLTGK